SSALALIAGISMAVLVGNPYLERTRKLTPTMLGVAIVGLGAGMNLLTVLRAGAHGIGFTVASIGVTLLLARVIGRALKVDDDTSLLIGVGTAICGGSAIAAIAPVIRAKPQQISVALGTVFLLNACALVIFPAIGHRLSLTEDQFGLWGALAIHDTSSVVGATMQYGAHALEVGTTVKLARALWIVPIALAIGWTRRRDESAGKGKPNRPWFVLGFLAMAAIVTAVPALASVGHHIELIARRALVATLFIIGANLTPRTLASVGVRPFIQGVALWICVACATLAAIVAGL
ncbi:MAG: YeiH family protein, partial [Polyangiales bacterium]